MLTKIPAAARGAARTGLLPRDWVPVPHSPPVNLEDPMNIGIGVGTLIIIIILAVLIF